MQNVMVAFQIVVTSMYICNCRTSILNELKEERKVKKSPPFFSCVVVIVTTIKNIPTKTHPSVDRHGLKDLTLE